MTRNRIITRFSSRWIVAVNSRVFSIVSVVYNGNDKALTNFVEHAFAHFRSLQRVIVMAQIQSPSRLFDEIAELFASAPQPAEILAFKPSVASVNRASELLALNRTGHVTEDIRQELEQFEQAELLMRLVKARIRAGQTPEPIE